MHIVGLLILSLSLVSASEKAPKPKHSAPPEYEAPVTGKTYKPEGKTLSDPDLAFREYMVKIARQLGVTCNYCHDVKNFKSPLKPAFKTAQEHIRIVDLLNKNGFNGSRGNPMADCYMCHRGQAKPDYKEKLPTN